MKVVDPTMDNNDIDDKITIMLSRRDVSALAILINAGSIGVQSTQNIMKLAVGVPEPVDKYLTDTCTDAGIVFERMMKLASDKWPNGLIDPNPKVESAEVAPTESADTKVSAE